MKNLAGLLGGIVLGAGLLFTSAKTYSQEFYGHGQVAIEAGMDIAPIYQEDWGNVDSGGLINLGAEVRAGFGYNSGFFDLGTGAQFDLSMNGDLTGGYEGYFQVVSKTPMFSPNVGAFARASVFERNFFMEYSVNFINQCSLLTGERSFEVDNNPGGMVDIDEKRDIESREPLAEYIDHKIIGGIHVPFDNGSFFEVFAGVMIPQITKKEPLWDELGMTAEPTFTIGGKLGVEPYSSY